jgi:hypothetical protein
MSDLEAAADGDPAGPGGRPAAAQQIAAALDEPLLWLIENVVKVLGQTRAEELLRQTQEIEAAGGMLTAGGEQRRTAGGVYIKLVKEQASAADLERILRGPKAKPPPQPEGSLEGARHPADPVPIGPLPWEEAKVEVAQIVKTPMERASVKITIVGRPNQVSRTKSCVVVAMKGSRPPSLPKGLPLAPEGSDFSYAVFIALKHWAKVAPVMAQDKDEKLLVEGYPIFDPKRGVTVILAQNVRTVNLARRHRSSS